MTSTHRLIVSDVTLRQADSHDVHRGLIGWITCRINGTLSVDGITLRRTLEGRLTLGFPSRTDASGQRHPILRPIDATARRTVEDQVFSALGLTAEPH